MKTSYFIRKLKQLILMFYLMVLVIVQVQWFHCKQAHWPEKHSIVEGDETPLHLGTEFYTP